MEHENPCNRTISLTKAAATPVAVKGCLRGMKWAYLLNLSTTMSRESNTPDFGSPSIKSIDILPSQICPGMGSGCRSHAGDNAIFWSSRQTGHSSTNFLMFAFIPLQYRLLASLLYVRRNPECLPSKLLWNSLNTAGIIEDKRRSTKQPLNNNLPVPMRNEDGNQSACKSCFSFDRRGFPIHLSTDFPDIQQYWNGKDREFHGWRYAGRRINCSVFQAWSVLYLKLIPSILLPTSKIVPVLRVVPRDTSSSFDQCGKWSVDQQVVPPFLNCQYNGH